jgi:hypothetical protein
VDITLRSRTIGFLLRRRHSGKFAPAGCFPGTILVSVPDASNDNVRDHTHDRGPISVTKSWPMAAAIAEQRKRVLYVSPRGCPPGATNMMKGS